MKKPHKKDILMYEYEKVKYSCAAYLVELMQVWWKLPAYTKTINIQFHQLLQPFSALSTLFEQFW